MMQSEIKTRSSFISSFMIILTNPATILSFMIIFSTFGVSGKGHLFDKVLLVSGIFIGTGLWWIILSGIVKWSKRLFTNSLYKQLNRWFGNAVILLGILIALYTSLE